MAAKAIPEGYGTVTPYLVIKGAAKALDWYKDALSAEITFAMPGPDGRIMHAEMRIGNSFIMICDEFPEQESTWKSPQSLRGVSAGMWLYLEDCDAAFQRAVAAGAKAENAPADMFWGDRYGRFTDPFGHSWAVATHKEDLSPEEMENRQKEFMAGMAAQKGS